MIIETSTQREAHHDDAPPSDSTTRTLMRRITRLEIMVAALIATVMLVLILIEPNILEAPFENERTLLFTFGGTVLAALAFAAMLWFRVPSIIRVIVSLVPFVIVNWWLISPYFVDDVIDEDFSTSISEQVATVDDTPVVASPPEVPVAEAPVTSGAPIVEGEPVDEVPSSTAASTEQEPPPPPPTGYVLLGAGQFVGLAGHSGTGDAGIFQNADGSLVLRFENFDIENGPDLEVYLVPGPDQVSLPDGSIHLGALKGNVGDQNYDLPAGTELAPGAYTALVWCEAFSVEFVGATIVV
jgi:hypothetical protein